MLFTSILNLIFLIFKTDSTKQLQSIVSKVKNFLSDWVVLQYVKPLKKNVIFEVERKRKRNWNFPTIEYFPSKTFHFVMVRSFLFSFWFSLQLFISLVRIRSFSNLFPIVCFLVPLLQYLLLWVQSSLAKKMTNYLS